MRPKSTSTISISLETNQSTKVTQIFCPRIKHSLYSWGELGIPALNSTGILLRLPPATKNLMDTKTPCRNHHGGYKIIQEWAGRERVKEQTDTKSEQTNKQTHSLGSSRNCTAQAQNPAWKPLAQRREMPRGSRRFQSSGVLLEATLLGQEEWQNPLASLL